MTRSDTRPPYISVLSEMYGGFFSIILYSDAAQRGFERIEIPLIIRRTEDSKAYLIEISAKFGAELFICPRNDFRIVSERTAAECTENKNIGIIPDSGLHYVSSALYVKFEKLPIAQLYGISRIRIHVIAGLLT